MHQDLRITRHHMFMEIAHTVAKRSTCMRLNVGAVLSDGKSIISIGYNGAPSGEPHCNNTDCANGSPCTRTIHAEKNALERADGHKGLDLYVTHSPCSDCYTQLWVSQQVGRVFFGAPYRETNHLQDSLFDLPIYRVLPSGLVVEWATGEIMHDL